jgi:hypothetical protein
LASKPALRRIIGHASSKRWACRAPDAAALLACGFLNTAASSGSAVREFFLFIGIGGWLGFIVLDGATYLLLALTLAVGLPLVQANAVKNAVAVPATIIAMLVHRRRRSGRALGHLTAGAEMGILAPGGYSDQHLTLDRVMGWMAPLRHRRAKLVFSENHQERSHP